MGHSQSVGNENYCYAYLKRNCTFLKIDFPFYSSFMFFFGGGEGPTALLPPPAHSPRRLTACAEPAATLRYPAKSTARTLAQLGVAHAFYGSGQTCGTYPPLSCRTEQFHCPGNAPCSPYASLPNPGNRRFFCLHRFTFAQNVTKLKSLSTRTIRIGFFHFVI